MTITGKGILTTGYIYCYEFVAGGSPWLGLYVDGNFVFGRGVIEMARDGWFGIPSQLMSLQYYSADSTTSIVTFPHEIPFGQSLMLTGVCLTGTGVRFSGDLYSYRIK